MDKTPILLSASTALTPGQRQGVQHTTRLQNPFGTPMMLDEVRFDFNGAAVKPGLASVQLLLGDQHITDGFIPITLLGKKLSASEDDVSGNYFSTYTWRLPKPLYLHPGAFVQPLFFLESGASSAAVRITYVGRVLPKDTPAPTPYYMPWVTLYDSGYFSGAQTLESNESSLKNPFNTPIQAQRLLGRVIDINGNVSGEGFANLLLRMVDHRGMVIVRDGTPIAQVFSPIDNIWPVNAVLSPSGYYRGLFDYVGTASNLRVQVVMMATREFKR